MSLAFEWRRLQHSGSGSGLEDVVRNPLSPRVQMYPSTAWSPLPCLVLSKVVVHLVTMRLLVGMVLARSRDLGCCMWKLQDRK